jgi:hypothetical protein
MMDDRKPLAELRRDLVAAAIVIAVVGVGAWLVHYWFVL